MSHDDFAFEPVPGLPQHLPAGERLIWQGAPDWRTLAVGALHVRKIAVYFGLLLLWTLAGGLIDGDTPGHIAASALKLSLLAVVALSLLVLIAWLASRNTVYSITNRRVVMRFGIALPMTINIPFGQIDAATLWSSGAGAGDIGLVLAPGQHFAYLLLWPHARPWRLAHPVPMLRALPDASTVASQLSRALSAHAGQGAAVVDASPAEPTQEAYALQAAINMR